MNTERRKKLIEDLRNKEYRDAFAVEHIDTGVPFQIRALREQKGREWTQKELGTRTEMAQETISRIEDPNYGKLTLKTLKRLASAFDLALMVRFVSFSELVEWELGLTSDSLKALSFEQDPYFLQESEEEITEGLKSELQYHDTRPKVIVTNLEQVAGRGKIYSSDQKEMQTPAHKISLGETL